MPLVSTSPPLDLHLDAYFSWHSHVEAIASKAMKHLYFKAVKVCLCPSCSLLHICLAVDRSVLEYTAPVWHHSLNKSQTNQIEAIQKRAIRIIFSYACDMPYTSALFVAGIANLTDTETYCHAISSRPSCSQHHVYIVWSPCSRDAGLLARLGAPSKFPRILD